MNKKRQHKKHDRTGYDETLTRTVGGVEPIQALPLLLGPTRQVDAGR